jgi:hypothetical protein
VQPQPKVYTVVDGQQGGVVPYNRPHLKVIVLQHREQAIFNFLNWHRLLTVENICPDEGSEPTEILVSLHIPLLLVNNLYSVLLAMWA